MSASANVRAHSGLHLRVEVYLPLKFVVYISLPFTSSGSSPGIQPHNALALFLCLATCSSQRFDISLPCFSARRWLVRLNDLTMTADEIRKYMCRAESKTTTSHVNLISRSVHVSTEHKPNTLKCKLKLSKCLNSCQAASASDANTIAIICNTQTRCLIYNEQNIFDFMLPFWLCRFRLDISR